MRVFITGSQGFVGQHLVRAVLESNYETCGPDKGFRLNSSLEEMFRLVDSYKPDVMVHLAALSSVKRSWISPIETLDTNLIGSIKLFEASRLAGVKRFITMSTAEVYQSSQEPLHEQSVVSPQNPYGHSKARMEQVLVELARHCGIQLYIVRAFNLTGPGQGRDFVVMDWAVQILKILQGVNSSLLVGNLEPIRDFLDVRDATRALLQFIDGQAMPGVYNVCSGQGRALRQVLADLLRIAGRPSIPVIEDPKKFRPADTSRLVGNPEKLQQATDWKPQYTWERTLTDVLEDANRRFLTDDYG